MQTQKLKIINKLGLHARASMKLISLAGRFQSDILIRYNDYQTDAKDILNVMSLGAIQGTEIEIITLGDDEVEAIEKLAALVQDRFGEAD